MIKINEEDNKKVKKGNWIEKENPGIMKIRRIKGKRADRDEGNC